MGTGPADEAGEKPAAGEAGLLDAGDVVRAYRRWAPYYDQTFGRIVRRGRRAAVKRVGTAPQRILELGVGTGISLPDYPPGMRIVGIDLSPEMLAVARRRVASRGLADVEALLEMDAEHLTFPDASFDTAVAMYVLTVVAEPKKVMAEMARVVRPGGRVFVLSHFAATRGFRRVVERLATPFGRRLGWHPTMTAAAVTGVPGLRLVASTTHPPLGLFSLLEFAVEPPAG